MIEISADVEILAEPTDVAAVMFDPNRDPEWVSAVTSVDVIDPALRPGARVRRTGTLLGRETSWTTSVVAFHFPHVLHLQVTDGPFAGEVAYQVGRSAGGSVASIQASGSISLAGNPEATAAALRAMLEADLLRLKSLIESAGR